jgi:uncharacterized protein YycO
MRKGIFISSAILIVSFALFSFYNLKAKSANSIKAKQSTTEYLEGDIIFQSSQSNQCKAVKLATHSEYSHVGMITFINGKSFVLEAVEPVRTTGLATWIAHGTGSHYTVMRLKNRTAEIANSEISVAQALAKKMLGIHYDLYFNWSDDQLYCSELIWKIYKRGYGVELCSLRKMKDFDLTSPEVKAIMKQRYGNNPPLEEDVVAPSDLSNSALLYEVEKK